MNIRLEYNEEQGCFYYETFPSRHEPNTYGWKTIASVVDVKCANRFCNLIEKCVKEKRLKRNLTFQEVEKCWKVVNQYKNQGDLLKYIFRNILIYE